MKKAVFLAGILCIIAGPVFSQHISILKPMQNGTDLKAGSVYPITWNATGTENPFKITLWRNGALVGIVKSGYAAGNGQKIFNWTVGKLATGGSAPMAKEYRLKVREMSKTPAAFSLPFNIIPQKSTNIGIIQLQALKPQPHRHRAPALTIPEQAAFTIKQIIPVFASNGQLEKVTAVINYHSKTSFTFRIDQGDPRDGPLYVNCKITNPKWPNDKEHSWMPSATGPLVHELVFNERLSLKYGGRNHLEYSPGVMPAGSGEFRISFTPVCLKKPMGLQTMKKMSGQGFSSPTFCEKYYSPKIELRIFVHAQEGVINSYMKAYLNTAPRQTVKIPGEINMCTSGHVYW